MDCFDLVLMDVQVAEMGGFRATTAIWERPEWQHLSVTAMTAHAMERSNHVETGIDDRVSQPLEHNQLLKASRSRLLVFGTVSNVDGVGRFRCRPHSPTSLPLSVPMFVLSAKRFRS